VWTAKSRGKSLLAWFLPRSRRFTIGSRIRGREREIPRRWNSRSTPRKIAVSSHSVPRDFSPPSAVNQTSLLQVELSVSRAICIKLRFGVNARSGTWQGRWEHVHSECKFNTGSLKSGVRACAYAWMCVRKLKMHTTGFHLVSTPPASHVLGLRASDVKPDSRSRRQECYTV